MNVPAGVDPIGRACNVIREHHVGGWEANRASALIALHDLPPDFERAAEHLFRGLHIATDEGSTDGRRRHGLVRNLRPWDITFHEFEALHHETVLSALLVKKLDGAFTAFAKVEIAPDKDLFGTEATDEYISDKVSCCRRCPFGIEFDDVDRVHAERFEELELARKLREDLGRGVRAHHGCWMDVEGHDRRLDPSDLCSIDHIFDDHLVATMHAVERAGGKHRCLHALCITVANDSHDVANSGVSGLGGGSTNTTAGFTVSPRCDS